MATLLARDCKSCLHEYRHHDSSNQLGNNAHATKALEDRGLEAMPFFTLSSTLASMHNSTASLAIFFAWERFLPQLTTPSTEGHSTVYPTSSGTKVQVKVPYSVLIG